MRHACCRSAQKHRLPDNFEPGMARHHDSTVIRWRVTPLQNFCRAESVHQVLEWFRDEDQASHHQQRLWYRRAANDAGTVRSRGLGFAGVCGQKPSTAPVCPYSPAVRQRKLLHESAKTVSALRVRVPASNTPTTGYAGAKVDIKFSVQHRPGYYPPQLS